MPNQTEDDGVRAVIWFDGGWPMTFMIRVSGPDGHHRLGTGMTEEGARRRARRMLKRYRRRLARGGARRYAKYETVAVISE